MKMSYTDTFASVPETQITAEILRDAAEHISKYFYCRPRENNASVIWVDKFSLVPPTEIYFALPVKYTGNKNGE